METKENKIKSSWSLFTFAREYGADIRVGECKTADGTAFPACSFSGGKSGRKIVHFGPSLEGGLSFEEIVAQANTLQVVELVVSPETLERRKAKGTQLETYVLCKEGETSWQGGNLFAAMGLG